MVNCISDGPQCNALNYTYILNIENQVGGDKIVRQIPSTTVYRME